MPMQASIGLRLWGLGLLGMLLASAGCGKDSVLGLYPDGGAVTDGGGQSGGHAGGPGKGTGGVAGSNGGTGGGGVNCLDRPQCRLFCEHGNQVDGDGCAVCQCNPAPVQGPCPTMPPESGSDCTRVNLICEYGDDPRSGCRTRATCLPANRGDLWQITSPRCTPLPDVQCPQTIAAARDEACKPQDAYCSYNDGLVCHCTDCDESGPVSMCTGNPIWHCDVPNTTAGCPAGKPALGSTCTQNGLSCVYGCGDEGGRVCQGGAWMRGGSSPCTRSQRSVKRDIKYLDESDRSALAQQIQSLRLARYHYRDPLMGAGQRLGFIIDDSPTVPAVNPDGRTIDLYAYSSMLVAASQEQARRIRALEDELAALRQELRRKRR